MLADIHTNLVLKMERVACIGLSYSFVTEILGTQIQQTFLTSEALPKFVCDMLVNGNLLNRQMILFIESLQIALYDDIIFIYLMLL